LSSTQLSAQEHGESLALGPHVIGTILALVTPMSRPAASRGYRVLGFPRDRAVALSRMCSASLFLATLCRPSCCTARCGILPDRVSHHNLPSAYQHYRRPVPTIHPNRRRHPHLGATRLQSACRSRHRSGAPACIATWCFISSRDRELVGSIVRFTSQPKVLSVLSYDLNEAAISPRSRLHCDSGHHLRGVLASEPIPMFGAQRQCALRNA